MGQILDARQQAAGEACVAAILAAGSTRLSVDDLRAAAGISKRTFHRYFPYKAQAIRPHYAAMTANFAESLAAERLDSVESWTHAWAAVVLGPDPSRSLRLFELVRADAEFWSVFLEVVEDGEREFAESLRHRTPSDPAAADAQAAADLSLAADVTAVALVASSRLALLAATQEGRDPVEAFRSYLHAFDPPLVR
ncbi:hypothetical protein [Frondihabitans cladoniiphilus]|uniref:TetR family transcriptional regulator n=1 Tax=Frondihabitans cladoniiphilus TaxID=715785 RepID=A0ABP8VHP7_9MICO